MLRLLVPFPLLCGSLLKVWVGSEGLVYIQSIIFDEFPPYCPHCKSLGHSKLKCGILHPHSILNAKVVNVVFGGELGNVSSDNAGGIGPDALVDSSIPMSLAPILADVVAHVFMDVVVIDSTLVLGEDVPGVDLDLDQDLGPTNAFVGNDGDLVNVMDVNVHGSDNLDMIKSNLDGNEVIVHGLDY
ncbi:hypothetical protein MA16_Dca010541 [Dendrobium catenatum]|uniref:Uncharacterized protein n=1 Tax=Dendrobium catenatum TaxID=906689 RepID=A0A2I0XF30_9ASPA|nr:hypothetical protein MA16_Dca010541 [Dendrobium catenatum]